MSDQTHRVTAEVVARFSVPRELRAHRMMVARTLTIPLIVPPTSPTERTQEVDADFLTFQARVSDGDYYLPPLPYNRNLAPITDTRKRVVSEVLLDYRVGHGIPGDLSQHEALVARIIAALDEHTRMRDA